MSKADGVAESKDDGNSQDSASFLKPGQKFPTPSPGSGDRVFYDTLIAQRPDSEMAQEWCVYHGTLEYEEADRIFRIICKRKGREYESRSSPVKKSTAQGQVKRERPNKQQKVMDSTNDLCDTGMVYVDRVDAFEIDF
ncbi:unnamed protein product [Symbiodinium microadriaticum]|nr:unnamed protein product [Symbiodinium microadriaticum]